MQVVVQFLLLYDEFLFFCKIGFDVKMMRCEMYCLEWEFYDIYWIYYIVVNCFLWGMVWLVVGMCMLVGEGKV